MNFLKSLVKTFGLIAGAIIGAILAIMLVVVLFAYGCKKTMEIEMKSTKPVATLPVAK